ncbi:DUF1768-domain-containing protein [Setomelanomma holmii]|uniref:DUF1768-domain-containing protein n=1 Tax=Setomelanomma holmii TaxID=210430 RepID=A0A9P4H7B2_9PLEO|nr:DUF1768-domain-containing protein [Setomelanomma holmii]
MPPKRKVHPIGRPKKSEPQPDATYFYMPNDKPYGVFCQWHPSPITIPTISLHFLGTSPFSASLLKTYTPSISFTCAEQLYMFCKALYFGDTASCTRILATRDPKEQKKLGKQVSNFNEFKWSRAKSRVARVGNWYKFTHPSNRHMKDILLSTRERELAKAARRDRVWGIGYSAEEAERYRGMWGEYRLGGALMGVRGRIWALEERVGRGHVVGWDWDGDEDETEKEGVESKLPEDDM